MWTLIVWLILTASVGLLLLEVIDPSRRSSGRCEIRKYPSIQ